MTSPSRRAPCRQRHCPRRSRHVGERGQRFVDLCDTAVDPWVLARARQTANAATSGRDRSAPVTLPREHDCTLLRRCPPPPPPPSPPTAASPPPPSAPPGAGSHGDRATMTRGGCRTGSSTRPPRSRGSRSRWSGSGDGLALEQDLGQGVVAVDRHVVGMTGILVVEGQEEGSSAGSAISAVLNCSDWATIGSGLPAAPPPPRLRPPRRRARTRSPRHRGGVDLAMEEVRSPRARRSTA